MLNIVLLFVVVCACFRLVASYQGFLVGPGRWLVLNIHACDNPEQYEIKLDIIRKKINRTHDCFDFTIEIDKEIDFKYGIEIELYQEVDGGFKYHQTMSDNCICTYLFNNARKNVEQAFNLANVDPPHCPVPIGTHKVRNYVFDYRELPKIGLYGTFEARVFITYQKKREGCVRVIVNFEIRNDDESNEEDMVDTILSPVKSIFPSF